MNDEIRRMFVDSVCDRTENVYARADRAERLATGLALILAMCAVGWIVTAVHLVDSRHEISRLENR